MLKCLEKYKAGSDVFLLVLLLFDPWRACMPCAGNRQPLVTAAPVISAKEQEEYKARIMACNFVKKHLGGAVELENIFYFKITAKDTYTMRGVALKNDSARYWSLTILFNGSDWNNINNWAELFFSENYTRKNG